MKKIILNNLQNMDFDELLKTRKELEEYMDVIDEYVITSKTDLDGIITYSSKAFEKVSGYFENELIGQNHNIIRHPDMPDDKFENLWNTISSEKVWTGEIKNLKKDGTSYWVNTKITPTYDHHGNHIGYTSVREDISDKKEIEKVALVDELTSLYNRRYYNHNIQKEINRAIRDKKTFFFLILDIDNFKKYNDNYGHQSGDKVLEEIGSLLNGFFKRATDIAFRFGGEEFCIIYSVNTAIDGVKLAEELCREIENLNIEHEYNGVSNYVTASLGLAVCNFQSDKIFEVDPNILYIKADKALYNAKQSGRNQVHLVDITVDDFL